ncbi:phosphotransferase [Thermoproteota archaeon]
MTSTLEQKLLELEQKLKADITPEEKFELAKIYRGNDRIREATNVTISLFTDEDISEEILLFYNSMCREHNDMHRLSVGLGNLAVIYLRDGRYNEAGNALLDILSICFDADMNARKNALETLKEAVPRQPDPETSAYLAYTAGTRMLQAYDIVSKDPHQFILKYHVEDAKKFFEMALEYDPCHDGAYEGVAYSELVMDNLELAAENYERAVELGGSKHGFRNLATTYAKLGRYADAGEMFEKEAEKYASSTEEDYSYIPKLKEYLRMMDIIQDSPDAELTQDELEKLAPYFYMFALGHEQDLDVIGSSIHAIKVIPKIFKMAMKNRTYGLARMISTHRKSVGGCTLSALANKMWKNKDYAAFVNLLGENRGHFNNWVSKDYIRDNALKLLRKGEVEHAHTLLAEYDISSVDDDDLKQLGFDYLEQEDFRHAWNCLKRSASMTPEDWARAGDEFLDHDRQIFYALDAFRFAGREDKVRACLDVVIQDTTDYLFSYQQGSTRDVIFKSLRSILEAEDVKFGEDEIVVDSNNDVSTLNIKYDMGDEYSEKRTFVVKQFDIDESEKNRERYRNEKKILTELEELGVDVAPTALSGYEAEHTALLVMSYVGDKTLRDVLTSSMGEEHLLNTVSAIAKLHTLSPMAVFEEIDRCKADPAYLEQNVRQHFLGKTFNRYAKFLGLEEDDLASERTRELIKASASAAMKDPEYFHPTHHNNVVVSDKGVTLIDFESMAIAHPCLTLCYLTEYGVNDGSGFRAIENFDQLKEHYIETRHELGRDCEWVDQDTQGLLQLYTHMAFLGSMLRDVQIGAETAYAREKAVYHMDNIREKSGLLSSRDELEHVLGLIEKGMMRE